MKDGGCLCRRWLWQGMSPEQQTRCYFFNSFFWTKLTEKSGSGAAPATGADGARLTKDAANHERVKKWTKVCSSCAASFCTQPADQFRLAPGPLCDSMLTNGKRGCCLQPCSATAGQP